MRDYTVFLTPDGSATSREIHVLSDDVNVCSSEDGDCHYNFTIGDVTVACFPFSGVSYVTSVESPS